MTNSQVNVKAAALSDWLRSVTCAERGQSLALSRTGWVSSFGLTSELRASVTCAERGQSLDSSPFNPEECHWFARRRKSIDMDCRICSDSLLGIELAGLFLVRAVPSNIQVETGPPGAQQGRLFVPPTMVEPSLIAH